MLGGCSSSLLSIGAPPGALPNAPKQAQQQAQQPNGAAAQREHQRILAAYNGAYEDPKLEALLNQTVDKLVAASERPDLQLPRHHAQRRVGQRLRAAERAALRHARADRARQRHLRARLGAVARDVACDRPPRRHARGRGAPGRAGHAACSPTSAAIPETSALALAKSKITLASFSRAQEFEADGIGVGIAARAGYDPYGAVRFLTAMGRNAELKANPAQSQIDPRARRFPLLASGDARAHQERARQRPPVRRPQRQPSATARAYLAARRRHGLRRGSERRLRARPPLPASQARLHLSRAGRLQRSTTPRRRCSACARAAARRCGSTWCGCRRSRRSPSI